MFGKGSSKGSGDEDDGVVGNNTYHPGIADVEYDELHVRCPPHTTERKIVTRIDWRVVPFLCILYLLAFLDRVNIANARSFHLLEDLGMEGGLQYNTALTIFFVPYIIFEVPSNILLKRFSPKVWLPTCMFGFGLVSICQGLVQNYGGLLATRFFLGFFEAGMHVVQEKASYTRSLLVPIDILDGIRGYHGWRWIFILEGLLTCLVALVFFFIFPSFPEQAKWLNEEERAYVRARLEADTGRNAAERKVGFRDFLAVMKDHRVWLGGFMYLGLIVPAYGIGTAWQVGFGNIGGIVATYSFLSGDAPRFTKGYAISLGFTALSIISCAIYLVSITVENRKRAKAARNVGLSEYEKTELGDLNPEFKYMY
ncbi:putative mfs transporter protein [Eutypa lata UCREL1]|uniref:Putative mfs transporter protein n=1 Tax=Eutypa lata (strain UCR-EL1) TaxID=1287681 RepID=M7S7Z2_EUTLA|nr:putative mfs transporter protein [Eutypa lata UCREL1]